MHKHALILMELCHTLTGKLYNFLNYRRVKSWLITIVAEYFFIFAGSIYKASGTENDWGKLTGTDFITFYSASLPLQKNMSGTLFSHQAIHKAIQMLLRTQKSASRHRNSHERVASALKNANSRHATLRSISCQHPDNSNSQVISFGCLDNLYLEISSEYTINIYSLIAATFVASPYGSLRIMHLKPKFASVNG